jgi:hypothetical protein
MPGRGRRLLSGTTWITDPAPRWSPRPGAVYPYTLPLAYRPSEGPNPPDPDPQVRVLEPGVIVRFTVSVTLVCGHRVTTDPVGIGSYWFHHPTAVDGGACPYGQAVNPAMHAAIAAHTAACEETS